MARRGAADASPARAAAEWLELGSLKLWAGNPRHNDAAVPAVARSIVRFGFGAPVLARLEDREVIAGHTRCKAARALPELYRQASRKERRKWSADAVALATAERPVVPVRLLDLTEAEAHALAVGDNKVGELAGWDDAALGNLLAEFGEQQFDFADLGFSAAEAQRLIDALDAHTDDPAPDESADDDVPEVVEPVFKAGDVAHLGRHRIHCGDCISIMRTLPEASVDAIVTDPPYGIGFMSADWDADVPGHDFAAEALRVLKPGGHIVAFAATRTVHRLAVALEDAGFEIRDMNSWLQWQGFPKSLSVSKAVDDRLGHREDRPVVGKHKVDMGGLGGKRLGKGGGDITASATEEAKRWDGWGTALKPAQEPAVLARKPLEGTVAECVLKHGTGAIHIDACRIPADDTAQPGPHGAWEWEGEQGWRREGYVGGSTPSLGPGDAPIHPGGRWPANIYYCPKPATRERNDGLDGMAKGERVGPGDRWVTRPQANDHTTVKPVGLMRWLCRLVTPPGGTVLEPFGGSGTTLVAVEREGFAAIVVELDPHYCDIIKARGEAAVRRV